MSIVIAQVLPDRIVMGADSAVTYPDDTQHMMEGVKIFTVENMLVGFVGQAEHASILRYVLRGIYEQGDGFVENPDVDDIIGLYHTYARNASDEFHVNIRGMSEDGLSGPVDAIMIGLQGKVFNIRGYQVSEVTDFTCNGCGSSLALGALYAGADMVTALDAACKYSIHCSRPLVIYESNGQDINKRVLT